MPHTADANALRTNLIAANVQDMTDGGMGSIRFVDHANRLMGAELAAATYIDNDGVPVQISLNLDREGELFELDMWKVDFSPLQHFPTPEQLTFA